MINKGVELNAAGGDCELMMETSGHGALRENRCVCGGGRGGGAAFSRAARASSFPPPLRRLSDARARSARPLNRIKAKTTDTKRIRTNRYLDDGAFLAVKAVIELVRLRLSGCDVTSGGCDLTALLRELKEPKDAAEIRIKIKVRAGSEI